MSVLPADRVTDLSIAADAAHAVNPWVALAYLAAGVLFILALRGLSSPATSQRGNRFGRMRLADRDQRDLAGIAAGDPGGVGDAGANFFECLFHGALL